MRWNYMAYAALAFAALLMTAPLTATAQDEAPVEEEAPAPPEMGNDLVSTLEAQGNLNTFVSLLDRAGLKEALQGETAYTVFAPTDDAFAASGTDVEALSEEEVVEIVRNHLVAETIDLTAAADLGSLTSVQGSELAIAKTDAGATINGAQITQSDIMASNGVIHIVDTVLMPSESLGE